MTFEYVPRGVCARKMVIDVNDGIVSEVQIIGGCHGNSQGVAALVKGMPVEEVIARLSGIRCGYKATSCPDQLAVALKMYLANEAK
ncbi:MAG: TIGR03905 family TSCPD domain-containing protein [Oscillospiraceae bacterium]|nr:TIGR03905 family TSCPD domain-containing protein [Oscillospiraceae bacterium]